MYFRAVVELHREENNFMWQILLPLHPRSP